MYEFLNYLDQCVWVENGCLAIVGVAIWVLILNAVFWCGYYKARRKDVRRHLRNR